MNILVSLFCHEQENSSKYALVNFDYILITVLLQHAAYEKVIIYIITLLYLLIDYLKNRSVLILFRIIEKCNFNFIPIESLLSFLYGFKEHNLLFFFYMTYILQKSAMYVEEVMYKYYTLRCLIIDLMID